LQNLLHLQDFFNLETIEHKEEFRFAMPKVIYLVKGKGSGSSSGSQLLNSYLYDDKLISKLTKSQQKMRKRLLKYFLYQNLHFLERDNPSLTSLRQSIIKAATQSWPVYSASLAILVIEKLVLDLNERLKVSVSEVFSTAIENYFIKHFNEAIDKYNETFEEVLNQSDELPFKNLKKINALI